MGGRGLFAALMAARFGRDRWNEHVKLLAGFFSAIGVACLIGSFVPFLVNSLPTASDAQGVLLFTGAGLHMVGQAMLRYIVSKD